jgi:hypothetical protein
MHGVKRNYHRKTREVDLSRVGGPQVGLDSLSTPSPQQDKELVLTDLASPATVTPLRFILARVSTPLHFTV